MAVLTQDAVLRFRHPDSEHDVWTLDTSTAQTIYKGSPLILDVSVDTVNLRHWVDTTTPAISTGNDVFVGIAMGGKVVAAGAVEANQEIEVLVSGEVGFKSAVFTDADVGKTVYMSDNNTLTAAAGSGANLKLGPLTRVQDGYAYVQINPTDAPTIQ